MTFMQGALRLSFLHTEIIVQSCRYVVVTALAIYEFDRLGLHVKSGPFNGGKNYSDVVVNELYSDVGRCWGFSSTLLLRLMLLVI